MLSSRELKTNKLCPLLLEKVSMCVIQKGVNVVKCLLHSSPLVSSAHKSLSILND